MNGKVETSLKQLSSFSKSLNDASDELSRHIGTLESALNSYNLGIWAWVAEPILSEAELSEPDEKKQQYMMTFEHRLGYGKHKGKWGLLVSSGYDWDDDPRVIPLREAPREVRVKAVDKIPDLLEALAKEVTALTKEASKKAAEAKELAATLTKKPR